MPGDKLRVEYKTLSGISASLTNEAGEIETLLNEITRRADDLLRQGWSGLAAQRFEQQFGETAIPATRTLSRLLVETGDLLSRINGIFQEADQEVAALFRNANHVDANAGPMGEAAAGAGSGGRGKEADIADYHNGVNGWSLISVDGSQGFTPDKLVGQVGNTCAIYGPMNLMIESGYHISQAGADAYANIKKMQEAWYRPDMWLDDDPNWGFPMKVSQDVAHAWNANVQHGDFREGPSNTPNLYRAEGFLVNTVQSGRPVMVLMQVDDSFGLGSGGHMATIVGVKTGADGRLQSVLTATNWADHQIYEIPAASFMDDWMNRNGGEYMTVDRAPVTPTPAPDPNGFSGQLLRELQAEDGKP